MTFQDIFKSSFLDNVNSVSLLDMALSLVLAFGIGLFIFLVYKKTFSGCKLIGVNAYSQHPDWAARLAEWITSEENQRLRFEVRGQGPANVNAANSPQVQSSLAIAALLEQSNYSQLQRVGGKFWDPVTEFATSMALGNPSGASLQAQLDKMVEGVIER